MGWCTRNLEKVNRDHINNPPLLVTLSDELNESEFFYIPPVPLVLVQHTPTEIRVITLCLS